MNRLTVLIALTLLASCTSRDFSPAPEEEHSIVVYFSSPGYDAAAAILNKEAASSGSVFASDALSSASPSADPASFLSAEDMDALSSASIFTAPDGELYGATQYAAELVSALANADIFRLEALDSYPGVYAEALTRIAHEKEIQARPALVQMPDLSGYERIFLGYPCWIGDLPMPLYTFLEGADLSGKEIYPFNTSGGSGLTNTVETIAALQPNAQVSDNALALPRSSLDEGAARIEDWLSSLGF